MDQACRWVTSGLGHDLFVTVFTTSDSGDPTFGLRFAGCDSSSWRRVGPTGVRIARMTHAHLVVVVVTVLALAAQQAAPTRTFNTVINLETTSEDSANVSMGDLDGDGDLDLVLAKGRHTPILDRVLLNDGKGGFVASDLGPVRRPHLHRCARRHRWGWRPRRAHEQRHARQEARLPQ